MPADENRRFQSASAQRPVNLGVRFSMKARGHVAHDRILDREALLEGHAGGPHHRLLDVPLGERPVRGDALGKGQGALGRVPATLDERGHVMVRASGHRERGVVAPAIPEGAARCATTRDRRTAPSTTRRRGNGDDGATVHANDPLHRATGPGRRPRLAAGRADDRGGAGGGALVACRRSGSWRARACRRGACAGANRAGRPRATASCSATSTPRRRPA